MSVHTWVTWVVLAGNVVVLAAAVYWLISARRLNREARRVLREIDARQRRSQLER